MIELYLSSDGKHTVHVSAETPAQMNELAPYARKLYEQVLEQYGTKPQLWEAAKNGQAKLQAPSGNGSASVTPCCPEHTKPLKQRKGRYGDFWSCPTRQPDGSWCSYTQQIPQAANLPAGRQGGQQAAVLSA
jgi:hypothetical protein